MFLRDSRALFEVLWIRPPLKNNFIQKLCSVRTQMPDGTSHMAVRCRAWNLPIDTHMDFVPLPVFVTDHLIVSSLNIAQLKLVIPWPNEFWNPARCWFLGDTCTWSSFRLHVPTCWLGFRSKNMVSVYTPDIDKHRVCCPSDSHNLWVMFFVFVVRFGRYFTKLLQ